MTDIATLEANLAAAKEREAEANRILLAMPEDHPERYLAARKACAAWIGVGLHEHKLWLAKQPQ